MKIAAASVLSLVCALGAAAQVANVDLYSSSDLAAREQALHAKVDPKTGSAGQTLHTYPNHLTMFILREKDGQSELHEKVADVFIAVDGSAELWTGGVMLDAEKTAEGEQRGKGLNSATKVLLNKGDIVHIPAGLPHQLRIPHGSHFAYFVVKSQEKN